MRFLVISDAPILRKGEEYVAYAPYVKEMDLWLKFVDQATFVCPTRYKKGLLTSGFNHQNILVKGLRRLEFHNFISAIVSIVTIPFQVIILFNQMLKADHIHLRAPGNLTLLGCFVQMLFPHKKKTAKYAGNWDPNSKQPLSYRMQKWLLANTFLTRNMQVLVYGEWEGMTKNIKPFFTASYFNSDKEIIIKKDFNTSLRAVYAGTMGANKRPLETVKLVEKLRHRGIDISLDMFGDGPLKDDIEQFCKESNLQEHIKLLGNQPAEVVKEAYKNAHFVLLLSQSEGWPKVIAEGMFWGAVPIATSVSCVPWMLGYGERGILIDDLQRIDLDKIKQSLNDISHLSEMSKKAIGWSRQYTMDTFAIEIKKLLS
ncbi:glycosyltransferase family 1 protein [Dokdonia sinensis]|uniref:Glycosyltransferase family 1 protein n=1 Tax=Dokdonia sinensis TaxID=2479847 RepID=A0A3M0GJD1_9FLAO|nr:glycosyltransferase [Dokdonia sinensis]RMB57406.1 glycosyltransferase family 1 protein [Dokdonia sinensis]